ncbi:hypothetical protein RSOLAG22IIIB_07931 [Rhizoctonia solani]|uniref:Thiaminase-2/PQQC domain-containing protein n=1 Tax=Rhizoctonia solani TaxID=456999 RepID=A0A0K6FQR1_9AGAM|nr:hypothetical protein RSOLAG22IIIB_07931 [Rhizoctonia solani]
MTAQSTPECNSLPNNLVQPNELDGSKVAWPPMEIPGGYGSVQATHSSALLGITQPYQEISPSGQREVARATTGFSRSFIDTMIKNNRDIWDRMVDHQFCLRMGNGTARLDGFKNYSVNGLFFLRNYVRYTLGLYSKTDDWNILRTEASDAVAHITHLANLKLQSCIQDLNIPEETIMKTGPNPQIKAYIDWINTLIPKEDWFGAPLANTYRSLHVHMAPCVLGYYEIATKLIEDPTTKKDTVFYKLWIEPNARGPGVVEYVRKFRARLDKVHCMSPRSADLEHWTHIFRKACELEISFFDTCL